MPFVCLSAAWLAGIILALLLRLPGALLALAAILPLAICFSGAATV